jgi:hypothetical protein
VAPRRPAAGSSSNPAIHLFGPDDAAVRRGQRCAGDLEDGSEVVLFLLGHAVQSSLAVSPVQVGEGRGQAIERATNRGDVIVADEVADLGSSIGQVLEDVAEVLVAAAPPLVVLEPAEEVLRQVVGPRDEPDTATGGLRETNGVAPQVVTMGLDVLEDDVDGLTVPLIISPRGVSRATV